MDHVPGSISCADCVVVCEGVVLWYSLIRDDVEIFRHSAALSYRDSNVILPYHIYEYRLRVCNSAGCVTSPSVTNVTANALLTGPSLCLIEYNNLYNNLTCQVAVALWVKTVGGQEVALCRQTLQSFDKKDYG